jgi:hypothetical protein
MTDNVACYGFRLHRSLVGEPLPVEEMIVATAQSFDVNGGAANVGLGPGDPVIKLAAGGVNLCDGTEGAGGALSPYGIVMGVGPYWDAADGVMRYSKTGVLPSDVAWGTVQARQSKVYVLRVDKAIWEVDVDDIVTATTEATYEALIGANVDPILTGAAGETRAKPMLDINTVNTTSTLIWRIVGLGNPVRNRDFAGANVKLLVTGNVIQGISAGVAGV